MRAIAVPQALSPEAELTAKPALRLSLHDSIHLVHRADWDGATIGGSPYLGHAYLCALEDAMRGRMEFRYALFHDAQYQLVGAAAFQVVDFEDNGSKQADALCRLSGLEARIRRDLKVRSLVCGNVFHCGDHGAHFAAGIARELQLRALEQAMEQLRADERLLPRVSALIFKEHWPAPDDDHSALLAKGYHELATDANMVMDLDPSWRTIEDYQAALTAKARTRFNAIRKRSARLEVLDMGVQGIAGHQTAMQRLFDAVLEQSPFVFGRLQVGVYADWKRILGDRMSLRGYFLQEELVGFSAAFVNGDCLDAQFVGIDYARNREHGIYLRMLAELVESAIGKRLRRINFGRTSEQAKSSIGAVPVRMRVLVKHRSRVANKLIGPFFRKVKPAAFEARLPFRR